MKFNSIMYIVPSFHQLFILTLVVGFDHDYSSSLTSTTGEDKQTRQLTGWLLSWNNRYMFETCKNESWHFSKNKIMS